MQTFNMGRVPPITFGAGRLRKAPGLVAEFGGGPTLIVADAILASLGTTDALTESLSAQGIPHMLAADIAGEPKIALVDALCKKAREIEATSVIALGGGAAMDAAKVVAAIAPSGKPAVDFDLAAQPLPGGGLPAIAIPTTAGTGSEVTRTAVISRADGSKSWFWGEELMFAQAILDPELTVSLPPHLTAWTGIDAVAHALEGATARTTSPAGSLCGLDALRTLAEFLPRAVADGTDMEARGQVLWASMVAGLSLHNCNTHMGHNISHALGSLAPIHHGLATGLALEVTLPELVSRPEGRENYARAAAAMGASGYATSLPDRFAELMRACKIDRALPDCCASVSVASLAEHMKTDYNFGMSQNAACNIDHNDLDTFAEAMLDLPMLEEKAA